MDLNKLAYKASDLKKMKFTNDKNGVGFIKLQFGPCEAILYKIPKGYILPTHIHSDEVISIILSGKMTFSDDKDLVAGTPGTLHKCGLPRGYKGEALTEVLLIVMQRSGTKVIPQQK